MSELFDMKSEKVFAIVGSNCLQMRIPFLFFGQMFFLLYALGFHACIFRWGTHLYMLFFLSVGLSIRLLRTVSEEPYII